MSKKQLYIEITNSKLLIAKLIESKKMYYLFDIKNIKLTNLETENNLIFNLSSIFLYIKNYLKQNNIKKTKTIVCLPNINKENSFFKDLLVLQTSLLISKSELNIQKIIGSKILKKGVNMPYKFFFDKKEIVNQLDFFKKLKPPQKTSPKNWLLLTIFLVISYTFFFVNIQIDNKKELENITQKNTKLAQKLKTLPEEIKNLQKLKIMNTKLEEKINKIQKSKNKTNNPLDILVHISKNIPTDCKLTKINISTKRKGDKKKKILLLEGITISQEVITDFSNKLSNYLKLAKTKIIKIQKVKNTKQKNKYIFKITCNI